MNYTRTLLAFQDTVAERTRSGTTHLHIGGFDSGLLLETLPKGIEVVALVPEELETSYDNVRRVRTIDEIAQVARDAPERIGSISLTFQLHWYEEKTLREIAAGMPPGVSLSVADYNMHGKTPEEVRGLLQEPAEKSLIARHGFEKVYRNFTKADPERFREAVETLYREECFTETPKHFIWHGTRR